MRGGRRERRREGRGGRREERRKEEEKEGEREKEGEKRGGRGERENESMLVYTVPTCTYVSGMNAGKQEGGK